MRLADLGFINAGMYLCNRILQRLSGGRAFVQRYYLVIQPVGVATRMPQRLGMALHVRLVDSGDPAATTFPRPADVIATRYRQGSTCLALFRDQTMVGFVWLREGPYEEDEVRCTFVPSPAQSIFWDYDFYIAPDHRNGIAFLRLWSATLEHLRHHHVEWTASRISAFAPASVSAHGRLGAIRVGQAFFLVLFGVQLMIASVRPFIHVSLREASRPKLQIRAPVTR